MKKQEIASKIDLAYLVAKVDIKRLDYLIDKVKEYKMASLCILPYWTNYVAKKGCPTATVIDFPYGSSKIDIKIRQLNMAMAEGASEVDIVPNHSLFFLQKKAYIEELAVLVAQVKKAKKISKVIVETSLYTISELLDIANIYKNLGVDYLKTSTGVLNNSTLDEKSRVISQLLNTFPDLKIKVAGGIKTIGDIKRFIELGCARIGTSQGVEILEEIIE